MSRAHQHEAADKHFRARRNLRACQINEEAETMVRNWAVVGLIITTVSFAGPATTSGELQGMTWPEAIEYVIQHGSGCSFFGPVAKNLGLSDGTTVDYRVLSKLGDPRRDFYVTQKAIVLSIIWKSGASRRYTASKEGLLIKLGNRSIAIPSEQAGDDFEVEKSWWSASISAEKRDEIGITTTIDCAN